MSKIGFYAAYTTCMKCNHTYMYNGHNCFYPPCPNCKTLDEESKRIRHKVKRKVPLIKRTLRKKK